MTIGLGFCCDNGVVFCADSQITKEGGLKFNDKKIFTLKSMHASAETGKRMVLCYAGSPEIMKLICERLDREMSVCDLLFSADDASWNETLRDKLEEALRDVYRKHGTKQQVELLCGIYAPDEGAKMYRVSGAIVRKGEMAECIGVGDSSVLRFLADVFVRRDIKIREALTLGSYMVAKAKTYIDGCGGPTQALVLTHEGKVISLAELFEEPMLETTIMRIEEAVRNLMYGCYETGAPGENFKMLTAKLLEAVWDNWNPIWEADELRI